MDATEQNYIEQAITLIDATLSQMNIDMDAVWQEECDPTGEIEVQIRLAAEAYRKVFRLLGRCEIKGAEYLAAIMEDNRHLTHDIWADFSFEELEWYTGCFEDFTFLYLKYEEALHYVRFFLTILPK